MEHKPPPHRGGVLRLGTCSWTAKGWLGTFYPKGTKTTDFIGHYAEHYPAVEIDATFYATPRASTVEGWADKTPETFIFAAKAPQVITHEKMMENCQDDLRHFLRTMDLLGPRLGPILFQFPYYAKAKNVTLNDFILRLAPFLDELPKDDYRFAFEIRNKQWLSPPLIDLLRHHNIPLAIIDHPWMPPPSRMFKTDEFLTGDFLYVRWLGDRKAIEKLTTTWDSHVMDRQKELKMWAPGLKAALSKHKDVFGFVNNHYSGYAPGDVETIKGLLG